MIAWLSEPAPIWLILLCFVATWWFLWGVALEMNRAGNTRMNQLRGDILAELRDARDGDVIITRTKE